MAEQQSEEKGTSRGRLKREERAERILNCAAELILRWGYAKTTIDDIARQAHVAKGTIYLHWKTREDLFWTLIKREEVRLANEIQERIMRDPAGLTLHNMLKHSLLATMKNPLMKAMILNDTSMLGELARREYSATTYQAQLESYKVFLEFLRKQGLLRQDLSIEELTFNISAISIGYLLVDPWMPEDLKFSDEQTADLMADAIQRTLEPATPLTPAQRAAGALAFKDYFDNLVEIMRAEVAKPTEMQ